MPAPIPCCCRILLIGSRTSAAWSQRWIFRCARSRIEARLVIVNNDFQRELGAVLGFNGVNKNGANGLVTTSGSAAGVDTIVSSALTNLTSTGSTLPGHPAHRLQCADALQRQPAGLEPGRQHRPGHPGLRLPAGPGTVGGADRDARRHHLHAQRDHGQPEAGQDPAGHRDPVPGVGVQRRDLHSVQGCGAVTGSDPADHAGQPHHPRSGCEEGHRRARWSWHPAA